MNLTQEQFHQVKYRSFDQQAKWNCQNGRLRVRILLRFKLDTQADLRKAAFVFLYTPVHSALFVGTILQPDWAMAFTAIAP